MSDVPHPKPFRLGLLLDSYRVPTWIFRTVSAIEESPLARVALVVRNAAEGPEYGRSDWLRRIRHPAYRIYEWLDARLFPLQPDASEPANLEPLLAGCPVLEARPILRQGVHYLSDADVDAIQRHGLDVALQFGFFPLGGAVLAAARLGVWVHCHGTATGGPPGFREVIEGLPATACSLELASEGPVRRRVLYRSHTRTDRRSVRRSTNPSLLKASTFAMRKLREIADTGSLEPCADEPSGTEPEHRGGDTLAALPGNLEMCGALARLVARYTLDKVRSLARAEVWALAWKLGELTRDSRPDGLLLPPKGRFWADPFPVQQEGKVLVFFEESPLHLEKGYIVVMEIDSGGSCSEATKVLERPYHLSYPGVFRWRGSWYMVPESMMNRTVELYRSRTFPFEWELQTVLLENVIGADPTLAEIDGRWWMFVNIPSEGVSYDDELHLFHAERPWGPWRPHRRNPVKSDVRSARPAGRIFERDGCRYRPAQDCSIRYGHAISINRIVRLDRDAFQEAEVARIVPGWSPNVLATHTLNHAGRLTFTDCLLKRARGPRRTGLFSRPGSDGPVGRPGGKPAWRRGLAP